MKQLYILKFVLFCLLLCVFLGGLDDCLYVCCFICFSFVLFLFFVLLGFLLLFFLGGDFYSFFFITIFSKY